MRALQLETLQDAAAALNIGARLEARKVTRGGIAGTKVDVVPPGSGIRDQESDNSLIRTPHSTPPHKP